MNPAIPALLLVMCFPALSSAPDAKWTLVRSSHFEVYSQSSERDAENTLLWLERLRAFFMQAGVTDAGTELEARGAVRVIVFKSVEEYAPFRPHPSADAFFLSGPARDYLVLPALGPQESGVVAHEYAHLRMHSLGVHFPAWLAEGIAEFFSTVRMNQHESLIGGDLPTRTLTLRQNAWIPLPRLLSATSPLRADRKQTNVFYAESWLLTDMLIFSPKYSPRLPQLIADMALGASDVVKMERVYGTPVDAMEADLRDWMRMPRSSVPLPAFPNANGNIQSSALDEFASRSVLADLLLASGRLDEAERSYHGLATERPDDAPTHAALATIALRKGRQAVAREEWKRAMELGIGDAGACYAYAILAEDGGLPAPETRAALRRAIALAPDFDDARYKLGLLENQAGDYAAALEQFQAMRSVPAVRAYAYWTAIASALTETDQREAAKRAASNALQYATTAEERASALRLAYNAATDLTVQVSRDANGNFEMVTARKPHGSTDWNPFIQPADQIRRMEGQIRKVECESGKITGFRVENASGAVEVALSDPSQVLIQGGTPEFVCGAEDGRKVEIEYAAFPEPASADGVLRGMRFR